MQLKKLELKGFKSFAEKTTLEFNDGVTAVVGPNGSGKSNIIEAIRWVMGEQSAKNMRGGRMHDVIFSGTNSRKAINIAEATLVMDNSDGFLPVDFEEVSVTRRITRSGDSEYLMNKQPCRLKDIVDLFMDSGLGRESFSIISQGQVEAIFNSKAEDRRSIFEEAAGVFKYKVRKQKAERKLEETQDNLDRVQDILYELNAQVKPLREQSDIAQSFLEQKKELTDLDIGLAVMRIKELTEKVKTSHSEIDDFSNAISDIESSIKKEQSELTDVKSRLTELDHIRDQLNEQLLNNVQDRERTEAALSLHSEKAKHKEAFLSEKQTAIEKQEEVKTDLEFRLKSVQEQLSQQSSKIEKLSKKIEDKKLDKQRLESDKEEAIEQLRASYIELMQEQTSLKNEQAYLEQQISKQSIVKEKVSKNAADSKSEYETIDSIVVEKREQHKFLKTELDKLLKQFQSLKTDLDMFDRSYETKQKRLSETTDQLQQAKAKRNSLVEMQENYTGYFAGVKSVMQHKDNLEGIVGTIADLIDVPKEYMEAIDTVLGANSQFVVVENEEAGREAIKYLKQKRAGRATFLPLTTVQSRYLKSKLIEQARDENGFLGIASDLIHFEPFVSNVIENLLGNTIIADSLKAANAIARKVHYRFRVVSLDGDIMNAGGSMTGGSGKRSTSTHLFSQKKELKELDIFISETEKTLEIRHAELQADQDKKNECANQLEEIRSMGEEKRVFEKQLQSEIEAVEENRVRLEREQKALLYESSEVEKELEQNETRLTQVKDERGIIENKISSQKQEMSNLSVQKEDAESQKEEIDKTILRYQEELNTVREQQAAVRSQVDSLENQIDQITQTIQTLIEDKQALESGEDLGSKEELEEKFVQLKNSYSKLKNKEEQSKEQHESLEEKRDELEQSLTQKQGKKQYVVDEKSKKEIELSRSDVTIDHLLDYLSEEYNMSYEEARLQPNVDMEIDETQKRVKLLKRGIEELGPVNLGSIEEYERIYDRWTFLTEQQNDLLEAKTRLYDTMDEMDKEVERRFKKTFERIQRQFAIVFPQMFGGGQAELQLTDPKDLLTSGVEIVAQPPGKKLTLLSLLSGGERALTAISLLFAIIQVRPIPFCILDEAEAALDEANVSRFGKYLHHFNTSTQFIVITHRKGTMEEADSLYGVTMQEKGVSKLVSVRLQDVEDSGNVS